MPLALPRLKHLNLNDNKISNCSQFRGHYTLEILEIRRNKLTTFEGLNNMQSLKELYCAENEINSILDLKNFPKL